jgi:hypothetical protein
MLTFQVHFIEALMFESLSHQEWYFHDAYWLGACVFIVHLLLLRPAFMHNKNVLFRLILMSVFWPVTYAFCSFHIVRMRMLKL